jgi:hypothetical protein
MNIDDKVKGALERLLRATRAHRRALEVHKAGPTPETYIAERLAEDDLFHARADLEAALLAANEGCADPAQG